MCACYYWKPIFHCQPTIYNKLPLYTRNEARNSNLPRNIESITAWSGGVRCSAVKSAHTSDYPKLKIDTAKWEPFWWRVHRFPLPRAHNSLTPSQRRWQKFCAPPRRYIWGFLLKESSPCWKRSREDERKLGWHKSENWSSSFALISLSSLGGGSARLSFLWPRAQAAALKILIIHLHCAPSKKGERIFCARSLQGGWIFHRKSKRARRLDELSAPCLPHAKFAAKFHSPTFEVCAFCSSVLRFVVGNSLEGKGLKNN